MEKENKWYRRCDNARATMRDEGDDGEGERLVRKREERHAVRRNPRAWEKMGCVNYPTTSDSFDAFYFAISRILSLYSPFA
jgi:hypothetical protein